MSIVSGTLFSLIMPILSAQQLGQPTAHPESPFQSPGPAFNVLTFRVRLTDFEAKDIMGRTWRSADLRGKVTLINVWDTSCGPCRQEHPKLQRFYDETKSLNHIHVVTFSLDEDGAKVRSYMKESGYTFPVIVDTELEKNLLLVEGGIPKSWIIDRELRRATPPPSWTFGRILIEIERLAGPN